MFEQEAKKYASDLELIYKKGYLDGLEEGRKENEELKEEISVLLSCANCQENKGGYVCEKEYNDKCLAQKIEYIKELKEEIAELKKDKEWLENTDKEQTELILKLYEQIDKMKCCHNCKNCEINFTNDSGIKYGCKKLRQKSDDCILNDYHCWELAE